MAINTNKIQVTKKFKAYFRNKFKFRWRFFDTKICKKFRFYREMDHNSFFNKRRTYITFRNFTERLLRWIFIIIIKFVKVFLKQINQLNQIDFLKSYFIIIIKWFIVWTEFCQLFIKVGKIKEVVRLRWISIDSRS